jgi:hypothetical protein
VPQLPRDQELAQRRAGEGMAERRLGVARRAAVVDRDQQQPFRQGEHQIDLSVRL